jgi:hypothetical protein
MFAKNSSRQLQASTKEMASWALIVKHLFEMRDVRIRPPSNDESPAKMIRIPPAVSCCL